MKNNCGYEIVFLPNGKREKLSREEIEKYTDEILDDWEDYFEDNWLNDKGLYSGESKVKGLLDRLGTLLIEKYKTELNEVCEGTILDRRKLKKIFANEISVAGITDEMLTRQAEKGRKRDMSSFTEKRKKAEELNQKYGTCDWEQCLVDTEGNFSIGQDKKYRVKHSDYSAKTNRQGDTIYKQTVIWVLKDKKGNIKGFASEEYKDMSKAVERIED